MELRDFVKSSVLNIISGVTDAQKELEQGEVVPEISEKTYSNVRSGYTSYQSIGFEVSVNTNEKEGNDAKLNVVAAVIGGGISNSSGTDSGHAAKLTFSVPVRFPRKKQN